MASFRLYGTHRCNSNAILPRAIMVLSNKLHNGSGLALKLLYARITNRLESAGLIHCSTVLFRLIE